MSAQDYLGSLKMSYNHCNALYSRGGLGLGNLLQWNRGSGGHWGHCTLLVGVKLPDKQQCPRAVSATTPSQRQLRFRRAWRLVRFGNAHSPGGASCQDCGGFLPPPRYHSPLLTLIVAAVKLPRHRRELPNTYSTIPGTPSHSRSTDSRRL